LTKPFEFVLVCSVFAHITMNWLWHPCPRIPLTRFLHCPKRR
jgi:hypothetical protein